MKPLTAKTVAKTPGRGPGTKGVFPRYVAIGNCKVKPDERRDLLAGRVFADFVCGVLIGVEVIG